MNGQNPRKFGLSALAFNHLPSPLAILGPLVKLGVPLLVLKRPLFSVDACGLLAFCFDTYHKSFIKGWVTLDLGEKKCDLYIREVCRDMSSMKVCGDCLESKNDGTNWSS